MLSKKMAFSLTSLITILALAFVVSPAMGAVLGKDFATTISLNHTASSDPPLVGDNIVQTGTIAIKVAFGKKVAVGANADADADPPVPGGLFAPEDVTVAAFNKSTGASVTVTPGTPAFVTGTMDMATVSLGDIAANTTVLVTIAKGAVTNNDPADVIKAGQGDDTLGANKKATLKFEVVAAVADAAPKVVSITDLPLIVLGPGIHDAFSFTVTLSEKPKEFKKDKIDLANATIASDPVALPAEMEGTTDRSVANDSTVESNMVYPYLVTIKPKYESKDDIVIKIKSFEDLDTPTPMKSLVSMAYMVKVNSDANKKVGQHGTKVDLPKDIIIPNGGYLVVTRKKAESRITDPGDPKKGAADIARRVDAKKQTYNLIEKSLGIDLEGFLIRGGTIDLVSPKAGLVISEIMWATDAGSADRQWIEIANTSGAEIKTAEEKADTAAYEATYFVLYEASETLPDMSVAANNIRDRVSTLYKGTNHWSIAGKGQSGRTEGKITEILEQDKKKVAVDIEIVPTDRLISMERAKAADGTYADGTMEGSWGQSMPPSQNFTDAAGGLFVGSPGTSPINPVADPPPAPEVKPAPVIPVAAANDIVITEIMVDTGNGRLPQWIELNNVSGKEVSLAGWSLEIENDAADTDAVSSRVEIDLMGTLGVSAHAGNTGKGNSLLLVSRVGRSSANLEGNKNIIDVSSVVGERGHYKLISDMAFMVTLVPPQKTGVFTPGDMAGNLDANPAWELPMDEAGRSSLIRHEMAAGMATMGTAANGWVLASDTTLTDGPATWYGSDEDAGTPGYDSGGPLPVELSHFRPARDKATGQVVITWATQSELNNAGFFIKRAQQKDGEFKVINATMIAGAGTTSEKQFYTFTDTTAQPNVVYYYQIEDVSLDGQRQTLTRGIRLKGHIGAAGKLTSTWGEIKASNE